MSAEIPKVHDRTQEIAASIQNIDTMSGYLAGMSAKNAVDTALANGRVDFNAEDITNANVYGNNLGIDEPSTDAERAMFEAATTMSNNGINLTEVSKVNLSNDFKIGEKSNDEVVGFLLGYIAYSPNLTSSQRLGIVSSGPDDTRPRGTDFQVLKNNLEYCLGEAKEGEADPSILLPTIPREFGLRDAVAKLMSEPSEEKVRLLKILNGELQDNQQSEIPVDSDETVSLEQVTNVSAEKAKHLLEIEEDLGEVAVEEVVEDPDLPQNEQVSEVIEVTASDEVLEDGAQEAIQDEVSEQDPGEVDISQYLNDPETLVKTLSDRDLDPGLRSDLRKVVTVWQELQHSELAKKLWEDAIAPRLDKLNTQGLKERSTQIIELKSMVDSYRSDYQGLTNLLRESRVGITDIGDYLRGHNMGESSLEQIKSLTKDIVQDDTAKNMVRDLGLDTEDADIAVRKLGRKIGDGEIEPEDAEKFINDIQQYGVVLKRKDLNRLTDEVSSQIKFNGWRNLVGNIEDLMFMARRGDSEIKGGSLSPALQNLERVFVDYRSQVKRGMFDSDLAYEVSIRAGVLSEQLERPLRLTRISSEEASWLTR